MVSKGGGLDPHWRDDGKELFYLSQLQQMAVDVASDKTFQVGVPRRLFATPPLLTVPDVTADGKRFLFAALEGPATQMPYTVVLNWPAALKK